MSDFRLFVCLYLTKKRERETPRERDREREREKERERERERDREREQNARPGQIDHKPMSPEFERKPT